MSNSCPVMHHGVLKAKGCSHDSVGNFGKLFPKLDACVVSKSQAEKLGGKGSLMDDALDNSQDSCLPAGYTFFAQFIDHDITLETGSSLNDDPKKQDEIEAIANLRTPTLDLDCIYGLGPEASPYLYVGPTAPGRLLTGNQHNPNDLPRSENGTALIGDPRNDENIFVSQMQLLFIRLHNKIYDMVLGKYSISERFEEAQKLTRYHYQYLVVHDFLARICDPDVFKYALGLVKKGHYPVLDEHKASTMPVEFSVAAYRFGHTTVRSTYTANSQFTEVDLFDERFGTLGFNALPAMPPELAVDWRFLLPVDECVTPVMTKAFDLKFPSELICMPDPIVGRKASDLERSLAARNLLRGSVMSLPSGQDVAKTLKNLGYPVPTTFSKLKLNEVIPDEDDCINFIDKTPLFYYLMREAEIFGKGQRMGPAGSAIILEVILGSLLRCEDSFLSEKGFKPMDCISGDNHFELADVVRFVEP